MTDEMRLLRDGRPDAAPPAAEVVQAARGDLMANIEHEIDRRRPVQRVAAHGRASRRRHRRLAVAAAASVAVVVGGLVAVDLANDTPDTGLLAGEGEPGTSASSEPANSAVGALGSEECGGSLPFTVPVEDRYSGPVDGPADGAAAASTQGQLVAHWTEGSDSIEVRWPAEKNTEVLANSGDLPEGFPVANLVAADLTIGLTANGEGLDLGSEIWRELEAGSGGWRSGSGGTFTFAIAAYETSREPSNPQELISEPIWGEGMCGVVQFTVRATDREAVLGDAEGLYDALIAPGGPLVPTEPDRPLVAARTEAAELEPVTPCDVTGQGHDSDGIHSTPVDSPTYDTADEALAAHLETRISTQDGPFGPIETRTVPTAGYTAISLPDGTIAYQFPDGMIAYFIASSVEGGWSITRYDGPTC